MNEYLKDQYQHLLNQFDLMRILSEYYINKVRLSKVDLFIFFSCQNEQIKQEYECKLSKGMSFFISEILIGCFFLI
jgi:hypothetical protein